MSLPPSNLKRNLKWSYWPVLHFSHSMLFSISILNREMVVWKFLHTFHLHTCCHIWSFVACHCRFGLQNCSFSCQIIFRILICWCWDIDNILNLLISLIPSRRAAISAETGFRNLKLNNVTIWICTYTYRFWWWIESIWEWSYKFFI